MTSKTNNTTNNMKSTFETGAEVEAYLRAGEGFDAFVRSEESAHLSMFLDVPFLHNCTVDPKIGHRVEVCFSAKTWPVAAPVFLMSGEVTQVGKQDASTIFPMQSCTDRGVGKGSMGISRALVPDPACSILPMLCERQVLPFGRYCGDCHVVHMPRRQWEQQVPEQVKQETIVQSKLDHISFHGQELVCAVRLHYCWDEKRGTDDGPWKDGIPFDGQDVWELTLVANDSVMNYWTYKPGSLNKLGRDTDYPRCWPFSDANETPYPRDGVDRFSLTAPLRYMVHWPYDDAKYEKLLENAPSVEKWLEYKGRGKVRARINDKDSRKMQMIQGRHFLLNRNLPFKGQRCEVQFTCTGLPVPKNFLMSGEVIKVHPAPSPLAGARPTKNCDDVGLGNGSMDISRMLVPWKPCGLCGGTNCTAGATVEHDKIQWGGYCKSCDGMHGSNWQEAPEKVKEHALKVMLKWGRAAFHGQEVDCAVRLNYSWDQKRGSDEGPWNDEIPFDGRDVWQLTLVADDSQDDVWNFKPGSLVNLGGDVYPRCWPWSEGNELPYKRDGVDRFTRNFRHALCVGPFGCETHDEHSDEYGTSLDSNYEQ